MESISKPALIDQQSPVSDAGHWGDRWVDQIGPTPNGTGPFAAEGRRMHHKWGDRWADHWAGQN
jgi:hypothetical protein